MSKVRVTLNYIDIAYAMQAVRVACDNLQNILEDAAKQEDAEFLKHETKESENGRTELHTKDTK
jgi:hypothetical protein